MLKNIRNEKSMQVDQLAQYIGFDTTPASWKIAYKEIKNNIPQNIKWLDKQYVLSVLKYYKLNDMSFIKKYLETIEMINSNFYLRQICYLWHYILYIDNSDLYKDVWNWKRSENLLKNAGSDMMPVVVLLSGYEKHLQNMKKRKYDNEQIRNIKLED